MKKKITKEIKELIKNGAVFYCSHSAGKDSQAMYKFLMDNIPKDQIVVVHSDLGTVEWDGVIEHIENTIEHKLNIVKSSTKDFISMVRHRRMFPGIKYRQCTSDLKRGPIYKFIRNHSKDNGIEIVVNCTGIRAEESGARSKKIPFGINKTLTVKKRMAYEWMPIFRYKTKEVFGEIKAAGQKPHYAYGLGMSRLSCCFCIMASKSDLKVSAKANPDVLKILVNLEKEVGHTMFMEKGAPIDLLSYIHGTEDAA